MCTSLLLGKWMQGPVGFLHYYFCTRLKDEPSTRASALILVNIFHGRVKDQNIFLTQETDDNTIVFGRLMEIIVKGESRGESHGKGQNGHTCHKTLSNGPLLAFLLRLLDGLSLHLNIHYTLSSI